MAKRKPEKLTHTFIKSVAKEGRYGDGRGGLGLSLLVQKTKNSRWSKTWSQRLHIGKARQEYTPGLGSWPLVTLADARTKAFENARLVKQGIDIRQPAAHIPTVAEAFETVIALKEPGWTGMYTKYSWNLSVGYCENIASIPISEITSADVLKIISPLWHDNGATADKVLGRLSSIMQWSMTEGHRTTNPAAANITATLGKKSPPIHRKSLSYSLLGDALATIRDSDAWWATRYCLLLLALTGVRSCEARKATWDEIDFETSIWTVPANRMKARIEHKVPLSTQAKEILHHIREQRGHSQGLIFPSKRSGKYTADSRLSQLVRNLHLQTVPHGFRSSIRTWAAEETSLPEPAAEMLLAHNPDPAVVKAYRTTDFIKHRTPAMQEWADFLTQTVGPRWTRRPGLLDNIPGEVN